MSTKALRPSHFYKGTPKEVVIAFDVDGTLVNNQGSTEHGKIPKANERIRTLLIILASFKNTRIIVWSGGGELYAKQAAAALGISHYVDGYYSKNLSKLNDGSFICEPDIRPDIAIDDIHSCELGLINLIVREK